VWSWASITECVRHREYPINIFFFAFVIFIAISIAYRSSFWADRVVFTAVAGVFALIAIKAIVFLTPLTILSVNITKSTMWTIAALFSLIALMRRTSRKKNHRELP
jgi:hypothetical protein